MSHSYEDSEGAYPRVTFHYNPDFSGDVTIINTEEQEIKIPGKSLLKFVAYCYSMPKKVEELEDMDYKGWILDDGYIAPHHLCPSCSKLKEGE